MSPETEASTPKNLVKARGSRATKILGVKYLVY